MTRDGAVARAIEMAEKAYEHPSVGLVEIGRLWVEIAKVIAPDEISQEERIRRAADTEAIREYADRYLATREAMAEMVLRQLKEAGAI